MIILFITFIVIPASFFIFHGYQHLDNSVPKSSGEISVEGVQASVRISTDPQGVKYINAESDYDAYFSMGFLHAQDRLWQLELQRRVATGTLSEIFGKSALDVDIYMRTMGIARNAVESFNVMNDEAKASLVAYSAGINSWIEASHSLPIEFTLLDIEPQRWQPIHSVAWFKMFGLGLSGDFQKDIQRLVMSSLLNDDKANALMPNRDKLLTQDTKELTQVFADGLSVLDDINAQLENDWGIGGNNVGSNAWVISGEHTNNGFALLAADPHLAIQLPSVWYMVSIKGNKVNASGASIVGLPIIMLGKNEHIAWASTNMMADTMDLYYEEINLSNNQQYLRGNTWKDFTTYTEKIAVKADFPSMLREPLKAIEIQVRTTEEGPIVSDIVNVFQQPVSLRWVGNESKDTSYEAFFRLNYANNWASFNQALDLLITPALNVVYVDHKQNIGQLGAGKIPIRGQGNGSLPVPGYDLTYSWQGFIPQSQMPQRYNPSEGYLVSANNAVVSTGVEHFISNDFARPYRAQRIKALIEEKLKQEEKLSIADQKLMQLDMFDLEVAQILPRLTDIESSDEHINQMLDILRNWQGDTKAENIGPTIFYTLIRHLKHALLSDEFRSYWRDQKFNSLKGTFIEQTSISTLNKLLDSDAIDWCDRINSREKETCQDIIIQAMQSSYEELVGLQGDDMSDWQWGEVHQVLFAHRPFSTIRGLDSIFERRISQGGSPNSINMSDFVFEPGKGYVQSVGSTFRQLVQFKNESHEFLYQNSTGQSGNLASDNYDDTIESFADGEYNSLENRTNEIEKTLILLPSTETNQRSNNENF